MDYPAHIRIMPDGTRITQTTIQHNKNVSEISANRLQTIGLHLPAKLAGLLHDFGKNTPESAAYQNDAALGKPVKRGSVIHTFQGCRFLMEKHGPVAESKSDITAELLAFAVAAHHGLFDCIGADRTSGFIKRIQRENISYHTAKEAFLSGIGGQEVFDKLFAKANSALQPAYDKIDSFSATDEDYCFCFGLLARLLLSAVIDGDRCDTAGFMNDTVFRAAPINMTPVWEEALRHMEHKLDRLPAHTPINMARKQISDMCRTAGEQPCGVFRLNVPTGGGKTLSALRFALAHAARHNKRRIIFTSPLLSILEQNSQILREYIGNDDLILEHHSDLIKTEETEESLAKRELLLENWDAPIIITTLVQLLNTMFDGHTTSIRRFWSLCDSVIIIDEVQTVPTKFLSLFNCAINFLSEVCNTTFVLCSATQPCLEQASHPLAVPPADIVAFDPELWAPFQRTKLQQIPDLPLAEIPTFILKILKETDNLLVICNKKAEAEYLFQNSRQDGILRFHLSAAMCPAHRKKTLSDLFIALEQSRQSAQKVLCVSTQVIEAGVDVSFDSVIRLTAGMDSVIQSAGRCNRNGENGSPAPVFILSCTDENLTHLQEIRQGKNAAIELLQHFKIAPGQFSGDLTSDSAIKFYYRTLWRDLKSDAQDGPLKRNGTLFSLLSDNVRLANSGCKEAEKFFLNQAFATAGREFRVFDDASESVVVPYGEGIQLIAEASAWNGPPDETTFAAWLERAKQFSVTIYDYQKKVLAENGMYEIEGVHILQPFQYSQETGITLNNTDFQFLEV